tara:strand:- start:365 stop:574 length:210 start_codon:yes stop_codon:yes gene_type:complete
MGRAKIGIDAEYIVKVRLSQVRGKKRPANAQVRSSLIAVKEQACKQAPSQFGARGRYEHLPEFSLETLT